MYFHNDETIENKSFRVYVPYNPKLKLKMKWVESSISFEVYADTFYYILPKDLHGDCH